MPKNPTKKCSAGSDLTEHCSGCTDSRSEGTHQGCTIEHGHVGCSFTKDSTIEGVMREFETLWREEIKVVGNNGVNPVYILKNGLPTFKDFLRTALSAQKEEIEAAFLNQKANAHDQAVREQVGREIIETLGRRKGSYFEENIFAAGWNDCIKEIESIVSSITQNEKK